MSNDQPLSRRILDRYADLPRAERSLADVVLGKGRDLSAYGAWELAREARVSRATAARFFRRLGYPNFRSAREAVRRQELGTFAPEPAMNVARGLTAGRARDMHLSTDIQNLRHTFESFPEELLDEAVSALAGAEKLWVVGFEDDYALAHFARSMLIRITPDIRMLPLGGFSIPEEFASITPRDTILGFGIHRRPSALQRILTSGREAGAHVLLVTEEHAADEDSLLLLRCRTRGAALFDSVAAAISVTAYLCSAVAAALGEPAVERLHQIESLYRAWDPASPDRHERDKAHEEGAA